jgi:hypothetical protein
MRLAKAGAGSSQSVLSYRPNNYPSGCPVVIMCSITPTSMLRIRKSPFASSEDPVEHMVSLLAKEAESTGTPFSEAERKILLREAAPTQSVPEELRQRTKKLIEQLLRKEQTSESSADPKNFGNSLEWAGEPGYPNIVALAEEVVCSGGSLKALPRLHGRRWLKDRTQLVVCAFSVVLLMFLIVVVAGLVFQHK